MDVLGALNPLATFGGAGEDLAGPLETVDVEPLGGAGEDLATTAIFLFFFALGGSGGADEAGMFEVWC